MSGLRLRAVRSFLGASALGASALGVSAGCHERSEFRQPELSAPQLPEGQLATPTPEAFLQALLPLPFENVRVVYDVSGPGGMNGELEIITRAGGYRREVWSLSMPSTGNTPLRLAGSTIRTPDWSWTDAVDGAPQLRAVPLGPLAEAFVALDTGRQHAIRAQIDGWNADLAQARTDFPGDRDQVLGQDCLVTSVVGHGICVWEQTALPLRYRSEAFQVTARAIDRDPVLEGDPFVIPAGGLRAPDDARSFDSAASLARLESGDLTEVARLVVPTFGLAHRG